MKSIFRAIRTMLRAMRRAAASTIRVTRWMGGKLVSVLLPAPMPLMDTLEPDELDERAVPPAGSEFMGIRNLAYAKLTGQRVTPEMLGAVEEIEADWIGAMTAPMLKNLLRSTDPALHAHRRGRGSIRGLLCFDPQAIEEFRIAMLRERAREEQARRRPTPAVYAT